MTSILFQGTVNNYYFKYWSEFSLNAHMTRYALAYGKWKIHISLMLILVGHNIYIRHSHNAGAAVCGFRCFVTNQLE